MKQELLIKKTKQNIETEDFVKEEIGSPRRWWRKNGSDRM